MLYHLKLLLKSSIIILGINWAFIFYYFKIDLWLSEKEKDGSVSLFSVSDFDTSTLRKDASLSNAYKSGKLGAKPNLGSPYIYLSNLIWQDKVKTNQHEI
jgi:hypothetical protein